MNVASLELCKELYELSGYDDVSNGFCWSELDSRPYLIADTTHYGDTEFPAYDLGYLLRKLPTYDVSYNGLMVTITYYDPENDKVWFTEAQSPEDAICKLVIELFKQGILKKGER